MIGTHNRFFVKKLVVAFYWLYETNFLYNKERFSKKVRKRLYNQLFLKI